jgi:uncharacterized membrane protein
MLRLLIAVVLCLHLLAPIAVQAQGTMRSPLNVPLAEYGVMLGIAVAGGVVAWIRKVRSGEYPSWSLSQLVGEMATSAFAGMLTFWGCEAYGAPLMITACLAGMSGLASSKLLSLAESAALRHAERKLGIRQGRGS